MFSKKRNYSKVIKQEWIVQVNLQIVIRIDNHTETWEERKTIKKDYNQLSYPPAKNDYYQRFFLNLHHNKWTWIPVWKVNTTKIIYNPIKNQTMNVINHTSYLPTIKWTKARVALLPNTIFIILARNHQLNKTESFCFNIGLRFFHSQQSNYDEKILNQQPFRIRALHINLAI